MTAPKLTPARREALAIIVTRHQAGKPARYSNETTDTAVHWQPTDWLIANGYARHSTNGKYGAYVTATPAGVELHRTLSGGDAGA
jgi:hypothetical protein